MKKIKRMIRAAQNNPLSKWNTFLNFVNKKNREFKKFKKKQIVKDKEFRAKVEKVVKEKRELIKVKSEKAKIQFNKRKTDVKKYLDIKKNEQIKLAEIRAKERVEKEKIQAKQRAEKEKIQAKQREEKEKLQAIQREEKAQKAEETRIKKEKVAEETRIEKEKAAEEAKIKKEKAEEEARIKKEKAEEEARIQREKAEELAKIEKEEAERIAEEEEKIRMKEEQERIQEQQRIIEEQKQVEELKQAIEIEKAKRLQQEQEQEQIKLQQERELQEQQERERQQQEILKQQQEQEQNQNQTVQEPEYMQGEIPNEVYEVFPQILDSDEEAEIVEEIPILQDFSAQQIVDEMEAENDEKMKQEKQQKIKEFKERILDEMKKIFKDITLFFKALIKNIKTKIKSRRVLALESAMPKEITVEYSPKSYISESFRTLRTNIQFMNANKNIKSILVTSTMPGEGKSYVATNLAATFAQANKKVVIVDADMRKGRVHEIFKVAKQPGLSNYLSGVAINENPEEADNYIKETFLENLYVLPMGNTPPNPSELISTEKMKDLIKELSQKFDVVIFDGTPSKIVTDSVILSREVDTTLIVTGHNKTKMDDLKKVQKDIENVGGKLAGVVINNVPINTKKYADSYYYESFEGTRKKVKKLYNL